MDTIEQVRTPTEPPPTHTPNDDTPPDSGDIEDPIDDHVDASVETNVTCAQCGSKAAWKGPLTNEMLARTFTRGTYEAEDRRVLPNCPKCGEAMTLQAEPTAIEQAAEQLAQEPGKVEAPRQPSLPGIRPPFDADSALQSIFAQRQVVRECESIYERKRDDTSTAKKLAEAQQEKLSRLEDDFAERYAELEREANLTPEEREERAAKVCEFERRTGQKCRVCRDPNTWGAAPKKNDSLVHAASAAIVSAQMDDLGDESLHHLVLDIAGRDVPVARIVDWSHDERVTVASWLERKASDQAIAASTGEATDTTSASMPDVLQDQAPAAPADSPEREEARKARPRHADPKARQQAKQRAAKAEKAEKKTPAKPKPAPKKPAGKKARR